MPPKDQGPLTDDERQMFDDWWHDYAQFVLDGVQKNLRARTEAVLPTSTSSVAQSIWLSFMERHKHEVELNSDGSAWRVLFEAAGPGFLRGLVTKRPDTANTTAKRRKGKRSLESAGGTQERDDEEPLRPLDPDDHRELPPDLALELAGFFEKLTSSFHQSGTSIGPRTRWDTFIERFDKDGDEEGKVVFSLKLSGLCWDKIGEHPEARHLGIDATYAKDVVWERIKRIAVEIGRKLPPES